MDFRSLQMKNGTRTLRLTHGRSTAINELRTFTAKTYFILQLGYFKAKKQFFLFDLQTVANDVAYILHRHFPDVASLSDPTISKPTRLAQQAEILRLFDYRMCSQEWKRKLQEKAGELVAIYTKPVYIFKELVNFLEHHRVVLPGYSFLQEKVIGRAITGEQNRLEKAVRTGIPKDKRTQLDNLLTAEESLYQLTLLKQEPKDSLQWHLFGRRGGEAQDEAQKTSAARRVLEERKRPVLKTQWSQRQSCRGDACENGYGSGDVPTRECSPSTGSHEKR